MKDHFVYAIYKISFLSVILIMLFFVLSNEEECILDKYPTVYFHGRILWRLADLRTTPQSGSEGDEFSENIILLSSEQFHKIPKELSRAQDFPALSGCV